MSIVQLKSYDFYSSFCFAISVMLLLSCCNGILLWDCSPLVCDTWDPWARRRHNGIDCVSCPVSWCWSSVPPCLVWPVSLPRLRVARVEQWTLSSPLSHVTTVTTDYTATARYYWTLYSSALAAKTKKIFHIFIWRKFSWFYAQLCSSLPLRLTITLWHSQVSLPPRSSGSQLLLWTCYNVQGQLMFIVCKTPWSGPVTVRYKVNINILDPRGYDQSFSSYKINPCYLWCFSWC